jgi:hypothetical protein
MLKKKISISILLLLLTSCGFKTIKQDTSEIYLRNINVIGETRYAYTLKNNIFLISKNNLQHTNQYDVDITLNKKINDKIKDSTGKTERYTLIFNASLSLKNIENGKIVQKNFSASSNYDVAKIHSDTINRKRSATENCINKLTDEITNFIILFSKN